MIHRQVRSLVSRILPGGQRWLLATAFLVILLAVLAILPVLPSLLSGSGYYGLRVDLPAPSLVEPGQGAQVPPPEGLALVFFGYQSCGTVCPVQLTNLLTLQRRLANAPVHFVFVTLDPERDSQQRLDQLMASLGPKFVAVRPESGAAARQLASGYNDYAHRVGGGEAYELGHSAHLHVVSSRGRRELLYTTPDLDLDRVIDDLNRILSEQPAMPLAATTTPALELASQ